jgi:PAS domain S-box-containing protein
MRKPVGVNVYEDIKEIASLRRAFDALQDHVIITDENGNILYANRAVEAKTGFSISEVIFKSPGDLWGGKMPRDFYEKMWHTIKEEKKPFVGEVSNRKKDGTEYWQELHIAPILDEKGEVKFFIGIEPDITDRKRKEKFSGDFVSVVGHQLRDPLSAILWTLEWLSERGELKEDQRATFEEIYKQSRSLSDLITDLLLLARVGSMNQENENLDLLKEVERVIYHVKEKNPKVIFSLESEAGPCVIKTVKSFALQVFTNIIANAAEYCEKETGKFASS